jgi:hypothetical protein
MTRPKKEPPMRIAWCRSCDEKFTSVRANNGKWAKTCSVECRIAAMRRFAHVLLDQADKLERGEV